MLNSAACDTKTASAPAGSPYRQQSSKGKELMHSRSRRWPRTFEISRFVFDRHTAAPSRASQANDYRISANLPPMIARAHAMAGLEFGQLRLRQ